jgi:hypothetical protein
MRRLGLVLACLVAIAALMLVGAGAALAGSGNGCGGSAGDSQYVDPLGCPTTSTSTTPPPTTPPPTTTTGTATPPPAIVASATATASSAATGHDPKSLPRTGLDVWAAVALGAGLLGAGIVIRRLARSGG